VLGYPPVLNKLEIHSTKNHVALAGVVTSQLANVRPRQRESPRYGGSLDHDLIHSSGEVRKRIVHRRAARLDLGSVAGVEIIERVDSAVDDRCESLIYETDDLITAGSRMFIRRGFHS
jgi:hypothetical protein